MGEAKRRGNADQRRKAAIVRQKRSMMEALGWAEDETDHGLRAGLNFFLAEIGLNEWSRRRSRIVEELSGVMEGERLETARPIRVQSDEIGWYLFLAEKALDDPLCLDVNQAARCLPFIAAIGMRIDYASEVVGLRSKARELVTEYRSDPDGLLFEILVALSYAESGWAVEMLAASPPAKSPDMRARKSGRVLFVECKRLNRRTAYAEKERNEFLRVWDGVPEILYKNRQWLWIKADFHAEANHLPTTFLSDLLKRVLPVPSHAARVYAGAEATIDIRPIDRQKVDSHMQKHRVKLNSPALTGLLGGDWAPPNSAVTVCHQVRLSRVVDCEVPALGAYIDEIAWASGITRQFSSETAIDKKARDVKTRLAQAINQLPEHEESVVHIGIETLEGAEVERRRFEKVLSSIPSFVTGKNVQGVRLHLFQPNQTTEKLWELDETVMQFQREGRDLADIPLQVVVTRGTEMRHGTHWDLYGGQ